MVSLPTGSDKLLDIRTANIEFVIKTKGKQAASAVKDTGVSSLKVAGLNIERISIPAQEKAEEYSKHEGNAIHEFEVAPLFYEQTDYILTVRSRNGEPLEFQSYSSLITNQIGPVFDNDQTQLSGAVNFGNNVGFCDFYITAAGKTVLRITPEVFPTKVSYRNDYREMMSDINKLVNECALDFMKKTYQVFVPDYKKNDVPAVFFTILQTVYAKYMQAANRILTIPNHKLVTEHEVVPHYKACKTDGHSEKWLRKHPEYVKKAGDVFLAERVLTARKKITYDTQENRLVKFMLSSTVRRIENFSARYKMSLEKPDGYILANARKMATELRRLLSSTFLAEVSDYNAAQSMSLVFGMAPGYRELYKYYLILQNGFSVGGDVFHMSVRETAQLYEYWCFIKLYSILKDAKDENGVARYPLQSPDIISADRKGVTVDLAKGKPSRVTFINTKTGELITLAYNPSESKTQTVNQRPDNVLELEKKGSKTSYKYVFDAKYRIEMNPESSFYPDTKPGPKVEDINTMHRYRDSIVYENPESRFTFEKTMFGAYILFPYAEEEEYKKHRFYKSIETVNIGGLPFLPSATALVTDLLNTLISDSSESAFERATLPAGIEDRIKTVDWNKRDVLIGFVPVKNHLDLFLTHNMYFTRRFNVANLPIRYVALYEKSSGILYFGELISWQREDSENLPGKSSHTGKYHVFSVKSWNKLPKIIKAKETGPNPIAYTNYFLLSSAETYPELRLRSEEEYRLFIELKRRTDTKIVDENDGDISFESGDIKLMAKNEDIYAIKAGKLLGSCKVKDFRKRPNATFRILMSYVDTENKYESAD